MCQLILTLIVGFFDVLNFIYVEKNEIKTSEINFNMLTA